MKKKEILVVSLKVIISILWVGFVGIWWAICAGGVSMAGLGGAVISPMSLIFSPCFPLGVVDVISLILFPSYGKGYHFLGMWGTIFLYVLLALGGIFLICRALNSLKARLKK